MSGTPGIPLGPIIWLLGHAKEKIRILSSLGGPQQARILSGERVQVKNKYKYIGVAILRNIADWRTHIARCITKAQRRSNDLLWVCRRDQGIRPRSAATLWKAIVRPVLEYAAELWACDIPKTLLGRIEKIQTDFTRSLLGLHNKRRSSNDFLRSELGLELLQGTGEEYMLPSQQGRLLS